MALSIDSKGHITTVFIEACKKAESQRIEIINGHLRVMAQRIMDRFTRMQEYRRQKGNRLTKAELAFERRL